MRHIDLFTGLAGFTLACQWNRIETVVMCEKDPFRRAGLKNAWPGIPIIEDVREFDGRKWTGAFILTGGVPCQPASRAGKQRGKGDDRWMWPEALRVVAEAKPRWCCFENPPGIYDVGLDGILADLEGIGYEVGICEIPACAVNAPHIRQRIWIVGHTTKNERGILYKYGQTRRTDINPGRANQGHMADTTEIRRNSVQKREQRRKVEKRWVRESPGSPWTRYHWTPCADGKFRRTPDDSFGLAHGLPRKLLAALGDSIVPKVAYQIIKAIKEAS